MKSFYIPPLSKKQKHDIPYADRLRAYAEIVLHGKNADEIASALYQKHGLEAPKHGRQAFGAFSRMVKRKIAEQDVETLKQLEALGFKQIAVEDSATADATCTAAVQESSNN